MDNLMTPREYLMTQNLAKPGKGKFSNEGNAALAKARAAGMKFLEPTPKSSEPKVKVAKIEKAVPVKHNVDPAAVRKWAVANHIEVSARGRLHSEIIQKYVDAHADNPDEMVERKEGSVSDLRQEAPRRYMNDKFVAKDVDGSKITKTFRDCCYRCQWSLGWCQCEQGPATFSHVDVVTPLILRAA